MNTGSYVFAQMVKFLDEFVFLRIVKKYDGDKYVKHFSCWNQLLTLMFGQLTGKPSLRRFIIASAPIQKKFYSLGLGRNVTRSNLSKANNTRDYRIFEEFAYHTVGVAQKMRIENIFKLGGKVYAFDSTTIDLCLSVYEWAHFRRAKGGIKVHTLFKTEILFETVQKVLGQAEALRFWNYPYEALEEVVVNSLYHRDYRQYEPVEITIEPDCICVLNCPGPDRSISKEALEKGELLRSRRYRNRRLGDFLKELDLTEGRSTGVPTIQEKLRANGSPRAVFETDEDRLAFLVTIPVHEGCENRLSSGISSGITSKSAKRIYQTIAENPVITTLSIAQELNLSERYVEKHIKELKELGLIERIGPKTKGGGWRIVEK